MNHNQRSKTLRKACSIFRKPTGHNLPRKWIHSKSNRSNHGSLLPGHDYHQQLSFFRLMKFSKQSPTFLGPKDEFSSIEEKATKYYFYPKQYQERYRYNAFVALCKF